MFSLGWAGVGLDVVHTGQHYDYKLCRVFFNELGLPDPVVNLEVRLNGLFTVYKLVVHGL